MGKKHSVVIHGELPSLPNQNMYKHWTVKKKEKDKWQQYICFLIKSNNIPSFNKAHVTFIRRSSREPDNDNLMISFKHCRDAIVKSGVLKDDSSAFMVTEYRWEKSNLMNQGIEIIIEEIESI